MGYFYLLALGATLAAFRAAYGIPKDVDIAYCHEGNITLPRRAGPNVASFTLL